MIELAAKKITCVLIYNHIVGKQREEIIAFGISSVMYKVFHLGAVLFIGLLFGRIFDIIVFHLFYQKLRTYAGGHHAKSSLVCFFSSCGIAVGTLTFWSLCPVEYKTLCMMVFLAVSFPIIWLLSPVEATNKPLDEVETRVYRKKARALLLVEVVITLLLYFIGLGEVALVGVTSLLILAIMLVLGKVKNDFSPLLSAEMED